jgi:antitoxin CptB
MLELDLMLEGFLDRGYPALESGQKLLFARMLEFEDQLLLDWLMGYVIPADESLRAMLEKIRNNS